ncbi:MAG: LysR substrate-binding domain-containing protein, partial [Burkholderiaceae bacterium]
ESFFVTLPQAHPLAKKAHINSHELRKESLLVLGAGHCFRDHVLEATPDAPLYKVEEDGLQRNFEGSSLETLRYMAAAGIGITVLPALAVPKIQSEDYPLSYVPLVHGKKSDTHVPHRRVVLIWRKNFSREAACRALAQAVRESGLHGVQMLHTPTAV